MASITPLPPSSSIRLTNLAPDVLTHVALCLATSSDPSPLGPPKHLLSLLLTNKRLYALLNYRDNACLYAEIFRYQFDVRALQRRLPASRLTAQNLAAELIRRWTSLKRISKQGSSGDWRPRTYPDHQIKEDLMTTFLMFLESDGRNAIQLIQYAQVHNWINQYYEFRLTTIHREPTMPAETDEASLAMWIAWLLTDYRGLLMEGDSRSLNWICTPYMLGTFFYKNSFAPWTTLSLPVPGANSIRPLSPTPNDAAPLTQNTSPFFIYDTTPAALPLVRTNAPAGPPPRTRGRPTSSQHRQVAAADAERFTYFGSPLSITAPLISHAATLLYFSRMQRLPFPAPNEPAQSPQEHLEFLNWQEQNKGLVYSGSTFIAGLDVVSNNMGLEGVESLLRGKRNFAPDYVHVKLPSLARSESWDDQFARLTGCWDPFEMVKELGMPRYVWTKGSLSGDWDGRFVLPDMDTYRNVMTGSNPLNTLEESFVLQDPQSWTIEEHYHVKPSASRMPTSPFVRPLGAPVRAGHPINAFIRPQTRLERVRGAYGEGLEVWEGRYDPAHGGVAFYETWRGGMQGSDVGLTQTTVDAMDNDVDMDMDDSDDDNDDENDCISIIITGTAIQRPYYIPETLPTMMGPGSTIRGTVRKWDGLITLVASPPMTQTWIWRGYLVGDGNFVGRWREGSMDVRRNAYEGVFAMRRRGTGTNHTTFGRQ